MADCKEQEACDLIKKGSKTEFIYLQENNWTQKYDLICDRAYIRNNSKFAVLVINTILCLFLLSFSDLFGRKKLFQLASLLIICGMAVAVVMPNFFVKMIGLGMATGAEATFSGLFTIYINENTTRDSKLPERLLTIGFFAYSLGCSAFNAVAYVSMKSDLILLVTAFCLVACVLPAFFMYFETPYYLYKKGLISVLFNTLMDIQRKNESTEVLESPQEQSAEDSMIEAFGFGDSEESKEFFRETDIRLKQQEKKKVVGNVPLVIILRSWTLFFH